MLKMSNSPDKPVIEVNCICLSISECTITKFLLTDVKFFIIGWRSLAGRFVRELIISEVKNRLVISLPYFPFPERSQRPEVWP
jgi:hypothetical protein